ncbi:MAG: hypothetical protein EOM23_03450 [Candidatus Moranbacteria bacterium]|nr:hypothetical protein [Candidatus Moranbacteria bacterium]
MPLYAIKFTKKPRKDKYFKYDHDFGTWYTVSTLEEAEKLSFEGAIEVNQLFLKKGYPCEIVKGW